MIKTVLVDDEIDAIELLKTLLHRYFPELEIIGAFTDPEEALKHIPKLAPQLLFLDIEMPHINGLELIDALGQKDVYYIFTTAYEQYALGAIKRNALDYLLKPIDPNELIAAVHKVRERMKAKQPIDYIAFFHSLQEDESIRIPTGKGWKYLKVKDIIYIRAHRNYCEINLMDKGKLVVIKLLKEFEEELTHRGFVRSHNSYLIQKRHIHEYTRSNGGWLVMSDGSEIPVSRKYRQLLSQEL